MESLPVAKSSHSYNCGVSPNNDKKYGQFKSQLASVNSQVFFFLSQSQPSWPFIYGQNLDAIASHTTPSQNL